MSLREYARKRRFGATPEPVDDQGARGDVRGKQSIFVVQLHHASHRHYDFRLQVDGALKSWAVPKGPSLRPGERRLAVQVEDHPLSYASFEGDIPKGNYGAGHVEIFDHGTWSTDQDPLAAIASGKLDFVLHGSKLKGGFKLVRTGKDSAKPQWLLFKRNDADAMDADADDLAGEGRALATAAARSGSPTRRAAPTGRIKPAIRTPPPARDAPASKRVNRTGSWRKRAAAIEGAQARAFPTPFSPQLCSSRPAAPRGDHWLHEIKWDGYRLLAELVAGKVTLRSRNGLDWTGKFPEIAAAIAALPINNACIDGELVALDSEGRSDFAQLQRALKAGDSAVLRYLAFDLPCVAGIDLSQAPLLARKELLEPLLASCPSAVLAYSRHIVGHGEKVFEASKGQGVEGIVSKRIDARYVQSRSDSWVKIKHVDTDEFVVVGYTAPKGSRTNFGALLVARRNGRALQYAGRVGTGFDDVSLREVFGRLAKIPARNPVVPLPPHATISAKDVHWVAPTLVAELEFRGLGKEGLLRQAAFKRLRDDKSPAGLSQETASAALRMTHPDRVVYPSPRTTKGQVAEYYRLIAPWILPELSNRPLSLLRCPSGAGGQCFFQKHYLDSLGSAVKAVALRQKTGVEEYLYVDDADGLLALVQMNTLEFHPWGSRIDAPEQPDRMVFDLDPDQGLPWRKVVEAAKDVRARLLETGLESFVRLTGGKGLHVVAPFDRGPTWGRLKHFCESFADAMVAHRPDAYVATMSKAKRSERIFIDWLRNARGATSVTSWSLRARPGAPVAVPLRWDELGRIRTAAAFDLAKATRRAATLGDDPWAAMYTLRQALPGA